MTSSPGDELIRMNNYKLLLNTKSNAKKSKREIPEICSFFIPMALAVIGLEKLDASTVPKRARSGLRRLCSLYCCGYQLGHLLWRENDRFSRDEPRFWKDFLSIGSRR